MITLLQYCNLDNTRDCNNAIVYSVLKQFLILFILNILKLADLHCEVTN